MKQGKLSVILLAYQSAQRLEQTCFTIIEALKGALIPYEIVIVDDGSSDHTTSIADKIAKDNDNIIAIQLSKNFTSPYAQFAGLSVCTGDCAAPMPDDLQRPIDHLIELYKQWELGNKVLISFRLSRKDGLINNMASGIYYFIMNLFSGLSFPSGGTDGYLIDREIIDLVNKLKGKRNTTPVIEILNLGFNPLWVGYHRPKAGKDKSRWTMRKKWKLAADTFFSSSNGPLRLITIVGFLVFFFSILIIVAIVFSKIFSDNTLFGLPIKGWATLVVLVAFFNGMLMLSLGIVAEYLWRMFEEVKERPAFIIRNKK